MRSARTLRIIQLPPKLSNHKESQTAREDDGGRIVGHPVLAGDVVDEIRVDANLRDLISEEGEETKNEHRMVAEKLDDARLTGILPFIIGDGMLYLRQVDTREYYGNEQDDDAEDGIRHYDIASVVGTVEEELSHKESRRQ